MDGIRGAITGAMTATSAIGRAVGAGVSSLLKMAPTSAQIRSNFSGMGKAGSFALKVCVGMAGQAINNKITQLSNLTTAMLSFGGGRKAEATVKNASQAIQGMGSNVIRIAFTFENNGLTDQVSGLNPLKMPDVGSF
ncbi:MAG: hypothetical protein V4489_01835 [Chlamydiota bacterium]